MDSFDKFYLTVCCILIALMGLVYDAAINEGHPACYEPACYETEV